MAARQHHYQIHLRWNGNRGDAAEGNMVEGARGRFTDITLKPRIKLRDPADADRARALHHQAHEACFIANSLNFPVNCDPEFF